MRFKKTGASWLSLRW